MLHMCEDAWGRGEREITVLDFALICDYNLNVPEVA
jgi:hypothetical protein